MNMNIEALQNRVKLPGFVHKLPKVALAAGISGLIVAALILMTPNPWFEAFIVETGLPGVLTAAEPPLGARARIVFALVAALLVTIAAWVALTVLMNRKTTAGSFNSESEYEAEIDFAEPVATISRNGDAHPDHPPRPPIMAGNDLGTPLDLVNVLHDQPVEEGDYEPQIEPEAETLYAAPSPTPDPFEEAEQMFGEQSKNPEPADREELSFEEQPIEEPIFTVPLRSSAPEQPAADDITAQEPVAQPESPAAEPAAVASPDLRELIMRLEAGLDRRLARKKSTIAQEAASTAVDQPTEQSDMDSALRDALDALQKVTAKGA